jgi:hypothetical protein
MHKQSENYLSFNIFAITKEFIVKIIASIDIIIAKLLLIIHGSSCIAKLKEIPEKI